MCKASLEASKLSGFDIKGTRSTNSLFGVCSGDELRERVTSYLRKIYPIKAADNVSADTKLPIGTVSKWFSRENSPSGLAVIRLIGVYGPELLCAIMINPPDWLDEAKRDREREALRAQQAQIAKRLERLEAQR